MKSFFSEVLIAFFALTFLSREVNAQGCSDAGFCTIGNLSAVEVPTQVKHKFNVFLPVGVGDESVTVFAPAVQYSYLANERLSLQAKITTNYASGNLGAVGGIGDLFLVSVYNFKPTENQWRYSVSLGTKIPLSNSNLKENNLSLPMQYQSSLGTFDAILGLAVSNLNWTFAAGWQQPLTGKNGNNFLPAYWNNPEAKAYIPTNDFNRKGDVLLRGSRQFKINNNIQLNTGLLAIYHLGEDTYIDGNKSNQPISLDGSAGLTLNINGAAYYSINDKFNLGLSVAVPAIVRTIRPDGLTRRFVLSPELSFRF